MALNCQEYLESFRELYHPVSILSQRNGAMIWRMRHRRLDKDVVLRCYDKTLAAYEQLKCLRHRNLPEVYDALQLSDGQIVLEEFVEGVTVAQVLESGLYTWHGAKMVLQGVGTAVETLHGLGLVHRDIKPENVMIATDGTVKLLDLNATRQIHPDKTVDTQILGTIGYASPEQLGIAQTDARTDIYALGVLLNVMLTGEHPSKTLARGRAGKIVLRCTQIAPHSRYQTVRQLLEAL